MADFKYSVGIDYAEALGATRSFVANIRQELTQFRQQAAAFQEQTGSVRGVSQQLAVFQGRQQAAIGAGVQAGTIAPDQAAARLLALQNQIESTRRQIERETGKSVAPPNQATVRRSEAAETKRLAAAVEAANADLDSATAAKAKADADRQAERATKREEEASRSKAQADEAAANRAREQSPAGRADTEANKARTRLADLDAAKGNIPLLAQTAAAEKARAQAIRSSTAEQLAGNKEYIQAVAAANVAERRLAAAINAETRSQLQASGGNQGTLFQRLQGFVSSRQGGTPRAADEYQTFGQFFTSKALTTAGFALSGGVLYGAISGFREIEREASALQRELSVVKSEFDSLGDSTGFAKFSTDVVNVATETGIVADQVAHVARQLAGVFRVDDTGLPDFNRALAETAVALKLSQVSGLPLQEITDSLTAITSTFGTSFTEIGDQAIGLEEKFGVLAPEIIRFTADLAPVAKELGFTVQQISALGAIAQQRSGVSGGALAESFNRALPTIQGNQTQLALLLGQRTETTQFIDPVLQALGKGEGAKVIAELTEAYGRMTEGQRNALASLLGGQRNAKAFFAVLQGGKATIDALNNAEPGQFSGKLERRFKDFQDTVDFAFEHIGRALEQFGLELFNSGLADGLKTIADAGSELVKVAGLLLSVFSRFNDALGGLPVKLLAVYAALRLIMLLRSGAGGLSNLFGAVTGRGGAEAAAGPGPASGALFGFAAPGAAAAGTRAPLLTSGLANRVKGLFGVEAGVGVEAAGVKGALAGVTEALAPVIAVLAVTQLVATVTAVKAQIAAAAQNLDQVVADKLSKGMSPDEILARAKAAGGDDQPTLGPIAIPALTGPTPYERALDDIQKANAERQGKELGAILKTLNGDQRYNLAKLLAKGEGTVDPTVIGGIETNLADADSYIKRFLADPANDNHNDNVARIIEWARNGGASPEVIAALQAIADEYGGKISGAVAAQAANDYAPILDEVRARFEAGNASLPELISAEKKNLDLLGKALKDITDPTQRAQAAQQLAAAQRQLDQDISTAAQKAADLAIKIAGIKGGDVTVATTQARIQQLRSVISQGASPAAQLDAALGVLDAQQSELQRFINSPVVVNGIARAPDAAEKLARAQQGIEISPEVRSAVLKAQLSQGTALAAIKVAASTSGKSADQTIDDLIKLVVEGKGEINALLIAGIDQQLAIYAKYRQLFVILGADPGKLDEAVASLNAAKAALQAAPLQDPGTKIIGDTTDLSNAAAIESGQEARALAEALVAQQRARANGDPVKIAQAAIAAAQVALRFATKPSERAAAIAQLIDAQNSLADAQNAIVLANIHYAEALAGKDPVEIARLELQAADAAVANAKGEAAKLEALAQQVKAQQAYQDAIRQIFYAQQNLLAAIAGAAGDSVKEAEIQLAIAQAKLNDAISQNAGEAAIANATADVIRAQAGVRDAQLRTRERDIDFALQMGQITTAQAIAQLQALLQLVAGNEEETQQILLKIKQLKDSLSQDYQFNIGGIKTPTLYEVKRLSEVGTPAGPSSYQDNRHIEMTVNAGNQAEMDNAVDVLLTASGAPPRGGQRPGNY